MRINVYSQELTDEVIAVSKVSNTGIEYKAIQFVLHSSPMLHHPPADDDRSAVTFWLPQSERGLREFQDALYKALDYIDDEIERLVPQKGTVPKCIVCDDTGSLPGGSGPSCDGICRDCDAAESVPQKGVEE